MTIFLTTFKRLLKSKINILMLFILPFIPILPILLNSSGSMGTLNLGICDMDNTRFTHEFVQRLKVNSNVVLINNNSIKTSLNNDKIDYAILITKNYTNDIISLKPSKLQGYEKKGRDCAALAEGFANSFMTPSRQIARFSMKNTVLFYKGISKLPVIKINHNGKRDNLVLWGMIIQFAMLSSIFTANIIIQDKENKTFFRSLNSPVSLKNYMFQTVLVFLTLSLIQMTALTSVIVAFFNVYAGKSLINMLILLYIVSILSVSFGVAVSSLSKTTVQSTIIGIGIVTFMCMVGGAWGMTPTSSVIKNISKAIPITWAMDGVGKLLNSNSLSEIYPDIFILVCFSAVFFLLGTWRKAEIMN